RRVAAPTVEGLAESLRALTDAPEQAAILCDIDGTLAPIVERADAARVPPAASRTLAALARRYGLVACISGRSALDARRIVGVGAIAYAGAHGAELLEGRLTIRRALFGGDDATDLDAFDALDAMVERRRLEAGVKVGVASTEGPADIVRRADVVVEGTSGFLEVLSALAGA